VVTLPKKTYAKTWTDNKSGKQTGGKNQWGKRKYGGWNDKPQRIREGSIKVGSEWGIVEEIEFNRLNKLMYEVNDPVDLDVYGQVCYFDKTYDRVSTKNEKPLVRVDKVYHNVTTSDDPIIQKYASEQSDRPTVYATDNILAQLMCSTRSVYSWDIVIVKQGNKLYLDKRDGGNFDLLSVNENATDAPMESTDKENINTPTAVSHEATNINKNFTSQVLKPTESYTFPQSNPFSTDIDTAPVCYRYRKWDLGDIDLIARTQIDAAIHQTGFLTPSETSPAMTAKESTYSDAETSFVSIRALNEFDSKSAGAGGAPEWRQKIDSQRGAVMATEIKNNGNKLARWTIESILSGSEQLRLGFVSRYNSRDRNKHTILASTFFKPHELAAQMNLSIPNAWGVVKTITDLCFNKLGDGKYVLMKDPNKTMVRLYQVGDLGLDGDEE